MAEDKIEIDSILIAPMEKNMARGAFSNVEKEFKHLANWFATMAFISQREKKSKTYVATINGELIGYITVSMSTIESEPGTKSASRYEVEVLKIGKLLVDPQYRGQGIGDELLKFAVDIALNINEMTGCSGIYLDSNNNERTIHFYAAHGFRVIETDESDQDTVPMFLKI